MEQPDGGGIALNVFFRARIVILSLLIVLALGAAGFWFRTHPATGSPVDILIALAILAALTFLLLRHAGLTVIALVAPLPALLFPHNGDSLSLWLAYLPGFFLAGLFAAEIARRAADGEAATAAARQTLKGLAPAALCALAAAVCIPAFVFSRDRPEMLASAGAGLCALVAAPLAASLLPFGEEFVARANRLRERRERWLAALIPAAQPRWGSSLSGVAMVIVALGFFGAEPLGRPDRASLIELAAMALVATAAMFLAMRDWRRTVAALLAILPMVFLTLWVFARMSAPISWPYLLQALGIGFIPVVLISAQAARFARDGEDVSVASIRALERHGAAILFLSAASAISLLVVQRDIAAAIAIALGAASALVFAPAFAVALEGLFPRRATIEARYRVR